MKTRFCRKALAGCCTAVLVLACGFSGCEKAPGEVPGGASSAAVSSAAASSEAETEKITQTDVVPDVAPGKYPGFFRAGKPAFVIPGLANGLVPQGMCRIASGSEVVVSCYSSSDGDSSVLACVDEKSGKLKKTIGMLNADGSVYTGHAGGVAASGKSLWVVSDGLARRMDLQAFLKAGDGDKVKFSDQFSTGTRASFTNCVDGVLWVGDFFKPGGSYNTEASHRLTAPDGSESHAWIVGFKLDPSSANELKAESVAGASEPATPDYVLSIPDEIQGMTRLKSGEFVLSQSYGRKNASALFVYRNVLNSGSDRTVQINGKAVPLLFLDSKNLVKNISAPPAMEALERSGERILILFESATDQSRDTALDPVDDVMSLDPSAILK